jgi:aspartate/methionine/tyrosine aminotransferase
MLPAPFALERFFARHEFSARYLLSASDCQGLAMGDLLDAADPELRARWDGLRLGYTESQGLPGLRAEIAGTYHSVDADQILVAAPEEAIFLAVNALLEPGDHVVCTFPGYQSLYELARAVDCDVDLWRPAEVGAVHRDSLETTSAPSADATPRWYFDPAELQAMLRPDTKLVVWNFPHNPTGALPSHTDFDRMLQAAQGVGAWVLSDEMYRLLEPSAALQLPAAADLYDRALSLAGMSKAYGLAGLRTGWAATKDSGWLERMMGLKDYTTICSSAPSELLALMALRGSEPILRTNRERVARNEQAAEIFLRKHRDRFAWIPPQAGTVCFPRLLAPPDAVPAGSGAAADDRAPRPLGAETFCTEVLAATGVLLLPSTVYDYGDSHFRLGLGRDDFAEGLGVLDGYLQRR